MYTCFLYVYIYIRGYTHGDTYVVTNMIMYMILIWLYIWLYIYIHTRVAIYKYIYMWLNVNHRITKLTFFEKNRKIKSIDSDQLIPFYLLHGYMYQYPVIYIYIYISGDSLSCTNLKMIKIMHCGDDSPY